MELTLGWWDAGNDPKFPKKPDGSRDIDTNWTVAQTWDQMEKAYEAGKAKAIGVSTSLSDNPLP